MSIITAANGTKGAIAFMIDRLFPSDQCIIDCLKASYNIAAICLTPLSGGADINAALYKVQTRDQSSYFAKLKHGYENDSNLALLEQLHASGIQQILPPIKTIQGHSIAPLGDFCLIVYPFIEGVDGFSHKLTEKQWITLGKALRQVHDFDVPSPLLMHIRKETYYPESRQAVRSLLANIQDEPATNDVIALKFLHFIKEHRLAIQRLVDRAEQLCAVIKNKPAKFVLCHSDIHAGNVLIGENGNIYIVDWDEPIMAPKERDLMFIGSSVGNVWNDPQEEVSFYQGYGPTDINMAILAYYRYERIVQDIAEYAEILLLPVGDNICKDRSEIYHQFASMFDPRGVVDVAFKTDKEFFKSHAILTARAALPTFLNQPIDAISCTPLTGGSEESPVIKCTHQEADYVVKLFNDTKLGKNEIAWTQLASDLGIGPKLYHADPIGSSMIIEFAKGNSLVPASANTPAIIASIATSLERLHHSSAPFAHTSDMFTRIDAKYKKLQCSGELKSMIEARLAHAKEIEPQLQTLAIPAAPCHNDLNPGNIFAHDDQVILIDWGDAALGNPYYDIAAFFVLNVINTQNERLFFEHYDAKLLSAQWQANMQLYKQLVHFEFALNLLLDVQSMKNELLHEQNVPQGQDVSYYLNLLAERKTEIDSSFLYNMAIASLKKTTI